MSALYDGSELTPIQEFYAGKNVFITGATGFLGKLVVDKLLRCCPGIGKIYLLVRPKKGKEVHDRISELFQEPVFSKLKEEYPKFMEHIVIISGDCSFPELGISNEDRLTLQQNVSIVFHAAANVKFNNPIKMAVSVIVEGTKAVLDLCKQMKNFIVGMHISTAYANCPRPYIEEKVYDPPIEPEKLIHLAHYMSDDLADYVTKKLLGKWPNTYTFTKAVTESVVAMCGNDLKFGIFRPSIVTAAYKEPIKGWIGAAYGPTSLLLLFNMGIIRTIYCDVYKYQDIVPADITVNGLIASAWEVANLKERPTKDQVPVYNCVSNNPMTTKEITDLCRKEFENIPMKDAVWYYLVIFTKHKIIYNILHILLHLIPGLLLDFTRILVRKKPKMFNLCNYISRRVCMTTYFIMNEWTFSSQGLKDLIKNMDERDRQIFYSDFRDVDWTSYMSLYTQGIRRFICNDPMETVPVAKIKWKRLYWAHQLLLAVIFITFGMFLWYMISTIISLNEHVILFTSTPNMVSHSL